LYAISNKYGVSVNEIKTANNLTSNVLTIGQVLKIPTGGTKVYTVVSGDTLYSIARKNNTTVSDLISLNNLSTSNLSIGQKLLIPN
jgi:LysM repeat protein